MELKKFCEYISVLKSYKQIQERLPSYPKIIDAKYDELLEYGKKIFADHDDNADTVQAFNISDSGSYTVVAVNHSEETRTFKLILSRNAPTVTMSENVEQKRLDIVISESEDLHSNIQFLEIYKSTDSGESWTLIFEDDYGNEISLKRDKYSFRTSGIYKVVLTDEFRTGIDAVTVQYAYGQKAPTGTLTGVENGGYTNGAVTFKWTDEATVTVRETER